MLKKWLSKAEEEEAEEKDIPISSASVEVISGHKSLGSEESSFRVMMRNEAIVKLQRGVSHREKM